MKKIHLVIGIDVLELVLLVIADRTGDVLATILGVFLGIGAAVITIVFIVERWEQLR